MEEKRSKYDTDPLDPDFVRRTEEIGTATDDVSRRDARADRAQPGGGDEAPTQRFDDVAPPQSYPSVFVPPVYQPPTTYTSYGSTTPPAVAASPGGRPSAHTVSKLGLPENVAMILPYAPFYIGLVASIVELLLVPRSEVRTRFHAAQGLALHLAIIAIKLLFGFVGMLTGGRFGGSLFSIAAFVFLIVSMVRVWKGQPHRLAPLSDATKWLNEQIEPRK